MIDNALQPLVLVTSVQMLLYAVAWLLCAWLLRQDRRAVAHWGGSMWVMSAAFLLIGLRGEPRTWLAYTGANVLLVLGYVQVRRGFELFLHQRPRDAEHLALFGLATVGFLLLGPGAEQAFWRVLLAYGVTVLIVLRAVQTLTRRVQAEYGLWPSLVIVSPGLLVVAVGLLRLGQQLQDPGRQLELHLARLDNVEMILSDLVGAAAFNFSYMTMVMVRMTRRLQAASLQDSLTGLPNRRVIEARLKHEWRRWARHAAPFTVLAVDLDHFKQVNDTHGHLAGDEMLVQVGQRLLAGVREVDTVARTGGEEFLLLLPDTDAAAALAAAERVRACVGDEPLRVRGQSLRMTTCVGVAQVVDGDADVAAVLARADAALYRAKAAGRNRVCGVDAAQAEGAPASTA